MKNLTTIKKMKKMQKKKNEISEDLSVFWLHTQNPRRFPGFTVVVVTLFDEILDDFHDFLSECVSLPRENQRLILEDTVFPEEKCQFSLDVKQTHTFYRRKSTKQFFARVSTSNNIYSFRIKKKNHTTHNNNTQ